MKRWLLRICVFLILGAIVNVAVACNLEFLHDRSTAIGKSAVKSLGEGRYWRTSVDHSRWRDVVHSSIWSGFCRGCDYTIHPLKAVPSWCAPHLHSFEADPSSFRALDIVVLGWPERAIWRLQVPGGQYTAPQGALWPGFAINTVFYAVVLWLMFAAPFALRRRRRIRRGLCPKCAYDLRGSINATVCPECGAAAKARRVQS